MHELALSPTASSGRPKLRNLCPIEYPDRALLGRASSMCTSERCAMRVAVVIMVTVSS
jgi:hypothetical protein